MRFVNIPSGSRPPGPRTLRLLPPLHPCNSHPFSSSGGILALPPTQTGRQRPRCPLQPLPKLVGRVPSPGVDRSAPREGTRPTNLRHAPKPNHPHCICAPPSLVTHPANPVHPVRRRPWDSCRGSLACGGSNLRSRQTRPSDVGSSDLVEHKLYHHPFHLQRLPNAPTESSARKNKSNSQRPTMASLRQCTPPFRLSRLAWGCPTSE